jgi:hypothetical protein
MGCCNEQVKELNFPNAHFGHYPRPLGHSYCLTSGCRLCYYVPGDKYVKSRKLNEDAGRRAPTISRPVVPYDDMR